MDRTALRDRLSVALHPLDCPPSGDAWNSADLADLLPDPAQMMPAAVLVPIIVRPDGATVILTRRTDALTHHAGQVSFPGGRIEPGDHDAVAAALREAHEEIGLAASDIEVLGYLDRYATITGFTVMPVLGLVDPRVQLAIDPAEVAEAFEVPLAFLLEPANCELRAREFRGRVRRYHVFQFGSREIWGATAAMIVNLSVRLERAMQT